MLDGQINVVRARIIAEATAELSAADAAAVEALVLPGAGRQTYVALDEPRAGATDQEDEEDEDWYDRDQWPDRDAYHLSSQQNETGDPASTPAAVRDTDTGSSQDGDDPDAGEDGDDPDAGEDSGGPDAGEDSGGPEGGGSGGTRPPPRPGGPRGPGGRGKKPGQHNKRREKRIAARINLTIPLTTLLELGDAPGDAGPFGPLDGAAVRDLARTAAAHPGTRWCLTVTDPEGRAVAHGCARGPKPWAGQASRAGPGSRVGPESGAAPIPRD